MSKRELFFLPLGGVGEIGMNLALYGYGSAGKREWIMVDCGVSFPEPHLPGVDLVMPDISFALELGDSLKGIVLTHCHEDHYGALPYLWPSLRAPVWGSPFAAAMVKAKLEGNGSQCDIPVTTFAPGGKFKVGPFEIESAAVRHSIPESSALRLSTPAGRILHSGDWKLDPGPDAADGRESFRRFGEEGILALVCDSTNAMREGASPGEEEVVENLSRLIEQAPGRVAVVSFSSHVERMRGVALAAQRAGRKVMLAGRSLRRVADIADELGYWKGIDPFVPERNFDSFARRELVILMTGSQGEPQAALARVSRGEHPFVRLTKGDMAIYSSRAIPGNERDIIDTRNNLIERGVSIVSGDDPLIHVSGHPRRDELRKMYEWTRPEILVPVHGEPMHLRAHAALGKEEGIKNVIGVRNGDLLRLSPDPGIVDQVPAGEIYLDGQVLGSGREIGVSARRELSRVGTVICSVVLDSRGKLADEIDILLRGLPKETPDGKPFEDVLFDSACDAFDSIPPKLRKDEERISMALRRAIRSEARNQWGKKPFTHVFVARVGK